MRYAAIPARVREIFPELQWRIRPLARTGWSAGSLCSLVRELYCWGVRDLFPFTDPEEHRTSLELPLGEKPVMSPNQRKR